MQIINGVLPATIYRDERRDACPFDEMREVIYDPSFDLSTEEKKRERARAFSFISP